MSSPTLASDKLTRQQTENQSDISTAANPDAVQIPAVKSSDIYSGPLPNATSPQTLTAETGSTLPELSGQTLLIHGNSVTQVRENSKEEVRLSCTGPDSIPQLCSEAAIGLHPSVLMTVPSPSSSSDEPIRKQRENLSVITTEANCDVVQISAGKSSDSGILSNAASSLTLSTETGSTAPELSVETPEQCDLAKHSASSQAKDTTINHEAQNVCGRQGHNEDHTSPEYHTLAEKTVRNEDQRYAAYPCPVTKEKAQCTKVLF